MEFSSMNEKRAEKRVNALVTVYCEHAKRFIAAYSLDVSAKGVFIKTRDPFVKGERVDLEFVLPDCEEVLKAVGEVRWVVRQGDPKIEEAQGKALHSGMGIEFVEISDRVQNNLREYVERLTGQSWEL
jgi:uncharacterized protein (TIGR02266 family)